MSRAVRVDGWRMWMPARDAGRDPIARGTAITGAREWLRVVDDAQRAAAPLHVSKHAATYRHTAAGADVYVKVYRPYRRATAMKDLARRSKARHVAAVSERLAAGAFTVPRVLAAAEERRGPLVRHSWVATAALDGLPLADALARVAAEVRPRDDAVARRTNADGAGDDAVARRATDRAAGDRAMVVAGVLRRKRALLAALGAEIARLHASGFVAGDLVPANVWVVDVDAAAPSLALLDHDRTRALRGAVPWWRARRNLVQLNRVPLEGVVLTDRLRVWRAYAATRGFPSPQARRRLAWVVAKTIERRRRFDHVAFDAATASFRELIRFDGRRAPAERPARSAAPTRRARGRRGARA